RRHGDLALLQRGNLRGQRQAPELPGARRLLRPAVRRRPPVTEPHRDGAPVRSSDRPRRPAGATRCAVQAFLVAGLAWLMRAYLLRRAGQSVVTLVGMSVLVFVILRVLPGDPARMLLPEGTSQAAVDELNRQLGLKEPLHVQYGIFLQSVF